MALDDKKASAIALEELIYKKAAWSVSLLHLHDFMKADLSQEYAQFLYNIPKAEQDKIFRKVDWRLCPMLAVLYLISHLEQLVIDAKNTS